MHLDHRLRSALPLALLIALAAAFFWQPLFTDRVLLPLDNIYEFSPWRQLASSVGVGRPYNSLLSDLVLENLVWKHFVVESVRSGQIPLWNPYLFGGVPFLAAGQHSAFYPTTLLFFLVSLEKAYGYVAFTSFALTGLFTYLYGAVIGLRRPARLVAAITFAFSGFAVVSVVFPMVGSAYTWLPLLLAVVELAIQKAEAGAQAGLSPPSRFGPGSPLLIAAGGLAIGLQFLAGHVEISYYVVLTLGAYTLARLSIAWRHSTPLRPLAVALASIALMVAMGAAMAGAQLIPLYELVSRSFRQSSATYEQVVSWAYPSRQVITFLIPDFFGNPSHHSYRDVFDWQMHPLTVNRLGQAVDSTWWGIKNYVEAGSYVGLLPLALAALGVAYHRNRYTWIFAAGAAVSLLFAFGTPAYWLPYHLLPGFRQLHSPFRWVLVYTLSISLLAGWGAHALLEWLDAPTGRARGLAKALRDLSTVGLLVGLSGFAALGLSLWQKERVGRLADRLVQGNPSLGAVFEDGRVFYSYEFWNLLAFLVALTAAAAALALAWRLGSRRASRPSGRAHALVVATVIGVVVADLFYFGYGFNTVSDPHLARVTPPSVDFLRKQPRPFRITTFGRDKTFWPNLPMLFGIDDIRGYDSIIPQQYVSFMQALEKQGLLEHNRIAPVSQEGSLDSPLLDLLNVEFVLSERPLSKQGYEQVYEGELYIYRRVDALPRAYFVANARIATSEEEALRWLKAPEFDPREQVIIEGEGALPVSGSWSEGTYQPAEITSYSLNRVELHVTCDRPGYVVLSDSYFPGWQARVNDASAPVYRANYNFRAVAVAAGDNSVLFDYSPLTFRLGLFSSFLGAVAISLTLAYWAWGQTRRVTVGSGPLGRVASNSLTPMATSLVNKAIDVGFAMLVLRLLGPTNVGKYYFAVVMIGYFDIFTNFGLNTLLIRDVAKDRGLANSYLSNTAVLRILLCLLSAPILAGLALLWWKAFGLSSDVLVVLALLALALVPGNLSAAFSSLFYAEERMEYPAAVSVITTLIRVALGVVVLLAGWGIVGLAGVAVLTNAVTASVFLYLVWTRLLRPRLEVDPARLVPMLKTSLPLMLNHMLSTLFFRLDVVLLQPIQGDRAVGYYSTAYKFIDGLNIIPSTFTFAVFPLLSRYAESARDSLLVAYTLSLRLLIAISLPIAVGTAFLAQPIVLFFGGDQYVPYSVVALQVLIWFLPFSYVNSLTQYVLIAVNQQRFITVSFVAATGFNLVINLVLIPRYSYLGASAATVLSEVVLLAPFLYAVARHVGPLSVWKLTWQPLAGCTIMAGLFWSVPDSHRLLVAPLAAVLYLGITAGLAVLDPSDRDLIRKLMGRIARERSQRDAAYT